MLLAGLSFCLVLSIAILFLTQQYWLPALAQKFGMESSIQEPYPTYTPPPTYTFFPTYTEFYGYSSSLTPGYIQKLLSNYEMTITIPSDWNIWETNPRKYDGYGDTCYDYLIDSPDYQHEIKISVICGGHGAVPAPCPPDIEIIAPIQDSKIIRLPDPDLPNKFIYATAKFMPECASPIPESVWLKFHGELHDYYISYQYNGDKRPDLVLADEIVLSFLNNP
jgi:hypothetical protein